MTVAAPADVSRQAYRERHSTVAARPPAATAIALLTGGFDKPYALGLSLALLARGVRIHFLGSDDVDSPELHTNPNLNFINLRRNLPENAFARKALRVVNYYVRLIRYAVTAKPKIFHILWNNRFQYFDRTLLMLYYRACGKKIVFTAHNVNAGQRDGNDSLLNRLTLRIQYRLCDHISVHTEKMKTELAQDFGIREEAVTVIPFGINNSVPNTDLTPAGARQRLGIGEGERVLLFFGAIRPYKGLEYLVDAFRLVAKDERYRLIIAGERKKGAEEYFDRIQQTIEGDPMRERVMEKIVFIPDEDTELYFKAADALVLPYTHVFQSGVLFLSYSFGLPVIASEVGSVREDITEGKHGFLCRPRDAADLARAIERYFDSELFRTLGDRRAEIQREANRRYSWDTVSELTCKVYAGMVARS